MKGCMKGCGKSGKGKTILKWMKRKKLRKLKRNKVKCEKEEKQKNCHVKRSMHPDEDGKGKI